MPNSGGWGSAPGIHNSGVVPATDKSSLPPTVENVVRPRVGRRPGIRPAARHFPNRTVSRGERRRSAARPGDRHSVPVSGRDPFLALLGAHLGTLLNNRQRILLRLRRLFAVPALFLAFLTRRRAVAGRQARSCHKAERNEARPGYQLDPRRRSTIPPDCHGSDSAESALICFGKP
jgi:hypothetical protein